MWASRVLVRALGLRVLWQSAFVATLGTGCIGLDPSRSLGWQGGGLEVLGVVIPEMASGCVLGPDTPMALSSGLLFVDPVTFVTGEYTAFFKVTNPAPRGLLEDDNAVSVVGAKVRWHFPELSGPATELNLAAEDEAGVLFNPAHERAGTRIKAGETVVMGLVVLSKTEAEQLLKQREVKARMSEIGYLTMEAEVQLVGRGRGKVWSEPFQLKVQGTTAIVSQCNGVFLCPVSTCLPGQDFPPFVCPVLVVENGIQVERCP